MGAKGPASAAAPQNDAVEARAACVRDPLDGMSPQPTLRRTVRKKWLWISCYIGLVTELRGVVDHHGARLRGTRRMNFRHLAARGEKRDVDAGEVELVDLLHRETAPAAFHPAADRTLARQRHQVRERELAFFQNNQQRFAHRTGGASDRDLEF